MKAPQGSSGGRDVVSRILTLALGFSTVDLSVFLVANAIGQGVNVLTWLLLIFAVAFVPLAYLSWRQNKTGYLVAAIVATVFNLLNLGDPTFPYLFTNPARPNFAPVFSIVIACSMTTLYGAYGFYRHVFTQTGSFDYHCTYHPWMTGSVVVLSS